jgi:Zn-finger nucleic acid-binding protein
MKCPVCNDVNLVMSDRQGVEIDYCPECRGVWLDRGELDKIIDRSSAPPTQQRYEKEESKQHTHDSRDYKDRKKKKRKNLLGELFDF